MNIRRSFALILLALMPCLALAQQKKIPALNFMDTEGGKLTNKNIPPGKPLLLIYFRSDCDHCEHTALQLKTIAKQYPLTIWMVSAEAIPALRTFEDMTGLYDVPNLKIVQDYTHSMHKLFDFEQLPYIVLYDKKGNQLKVFEELPSATTVKKLLEAK